MRIYYGVEQKNQETNVVALREQYRDLKEMNTPKIEHKKWTEDDEAKLTKLMSDDIEIDDTELGR